MVFKILCGRLKKQQNMTDSIVHTTTVEGLGMYIGKRLITEPLYCVQTLLHVAV